jgi:organic radical activating enzyme
MTDIAKIKEVFTSIQGEGPFVGYKQLFVRFCGCNLDCCYCDTNFSPTNSEEYTLDKLKTIVIEHADCHSISLTGGEPLLNTGFLKEFLPTCPLPVYLETNATLAGEVKEIIDYIDYISADIKLPSCTGGNGLWKEHESFFEAK